MRKFFPLLFLFTVFCIPIAVFAQEAEEDNTAPTDEMNLISPLIDDEYDVTTFVAEDDVLVPIAPDSPFYFFTSVYESLDMLLTFDDEQKLEKYLTYADRRIAEMDMVAEGSDTALLEKLQAKYEKHIENAEKVMARNQEKEQEMTQTIIQAQEKHIRRLNEVAEKVPLQAKENIQRAIGKAELRIQNMNGNQGSNGNGSGNGN